MTGRWCRHGSALRFQPGSSSNHRSSTVIGCWLRWRAGQINFSSRSGTSFRRSHVSFYMLPVPMGGVFPITHIFPLPTAAVEPVHLALASLLKRAPWDGQGVSEITLTLAGITDAPGQQLTLFDTAEGSSDSRARLTAILDRLSARFGADAFRLAMLADPDHPLPERRAAFAPWLPWHRPPHQRCAEREQV